MDLITTNTKKITIDLIGDPMLDLWQTPTQWVATPGGAFNVYENIKSLIVDHNIELRSAFYPIDIINYSPLDEARICGYPVKIYDCDKKWNIKTTRDSSQHAQDSKDCIYKPLFTSDNYSILVVSDYQKGFVERYLKKHLEQKRYKICIVDSRYANTDFDLLRSHSDILIWRKTTYTDAEAEFNWDYLIESDGPNPTRLTQSKFFHGHEVIISIPIEHVQPTVCSTGGGDTFTATVAASLAVDVLSSNFTLPKATDILCAIENAHLACQEVISKPCTSIVQKFRLY